MVLVAVGQGMLLWAGETVDVVQKRYVWAGREGE